jgi:hypothetical protein
MGHNDRDEFLVATDGSRRRRRRLFLLAGLLLILLSLLGFVFRDRLPRFWHSEYDQSNRFPPGVLADYVPEDSQAVLVVNARQVRESPAGRKYLAPLIQQMIRQAGGRLQWIELLGLNDLDDLDSLQISFAPSAGEEPMWLLRGRFDPSRVQIGSDKLQENSLDRFRVWEHTDRREKRTTIIAPLGDMLAVSESRNRVLLAFKHASNPQANTVRDATLRELLTKVDRQQTLWLAASLRNLGSINEIEDSWLKLLLRPLRTHAESVYGGMQCAEDVRADFHFRAATEDKATQLEMAIQSIRDLASEGGSLLVRQKELQPLLRLLGASQIQRESASIQLRSRLAPENPEE